MSALSDYMEAELRRAIFRTSTYTQRANSTAYSVGDRVYLSTFDGNFYECIVAGTSAGTPPTFNANLGDTTTDGGVTWRTLKPGLPKKALWFALFTAAFGFWRRNGSVRRVLCTRAARSGRRQLDGCIGH